MMGVANLSRNAILLRLSRGPGFPEIAGKFFLTAMPSGTVVQEIDRPMRSLHFPLAGMLSTVAEMDDGAAVEICCVGSQGMVNWESLYGGAKAHFRHFAQLPGECASVRCNHLLPFALHPAIARYVTRVTAEVARTAACNCLHQAPERLARWLLMASDKVQSAELALTQEFLGMMLGSRRATVSIAAGKLQDAGTIEYRRGRVRILDREALTSAACECYAAMRN